MTSHDRMRRRAPFDIDRRFEETLEILRHTVSLAAGSTVLTSYTTARGIALSRRECHLPGFDRAVQIATRTGFPIAVRPTGGRAAVMSDYSLVFEIFVATGEDDPGAGPIFEVGSGLVRDGQLTARRTCALSLTFDHRVADGAPAAQLLDAIASKLEDEGRLRGLLDA